MSSTTMSIKEFINLEKSKNISKYTKMNSLIVPTSALTLPIIDDAVDWIIGLFKSLLIKSMDALCFMCVLIVALSILAYIIDNDSFSPKKYITGGFVTYFGLRIVEYLLS